MGAGQSKSETIFSRYPGDSEVLPGVKVTPAVLERLAQQQQQQQLQQQQANNQHGQEQLRNLQLAYENQLLEQQRNYEQQVGQLKEQQEMLLAQQQQQEQQQEFAQIETAPQIVYQVDEAALSDEINKLRELHEGEVQSLKAELATAESNAIQVLQNELAAEKAAAEANKIEMQAMLEKAREEAERSMSKSDELEQLRQMADAQCLTSMSLQEAVMAEHKKAQQMVADAEARVAAERHEFLANKSAEKAEMIAKTRKFFSPHEQRQICGGIMEKVAQCYTENATTSLNCANLVRELTSCVQPEKAQYLSQHKHA